MSSRHEKRVAELRAEIIDGLTTDLNASYSSYECPNCPRLCLNPVGSEVERVGVCVDCHAYYLATGTTGRPR